MDFQYLIDEIVANASHKREHGERFEKLVKKVLSISPLFSFKEVYLWSEFSDRFHIAKADYGIDLMARDSEGRWSSIQCKCFAKSHKLRIDDINRFLLINNIEDSSNNKVCEIYQKLVFHTSRSAANLADDIAKVGSTTIYGYDELESSLGIDWSSIKNSADISTLKVAKKELRPHQLDALNAIKKHFLKENKPRGSVIMACGTGKSLLSIRAIDEIVESGDIALFLAPSLALINQMIKEFFLESKGENYKVFAVCSDSKVGRSALNSTDSSEDLQSDELFIAPTTLATTLSQNISKALNTGFPPPFMMKVSLAA